MNLAILPDNDDEKFCDEHDDSDDESDSTSPEMEELNDHIRDLNLSKSIWSWLLLGL